MIKIFTEEASCFLDETSQSYGLLEGHLIKANLGN